MIENMGLIVRSTGESLFEEFQEPSFSSRVVQKCALVSLSFFVATLLVPKPWSLLSLGSIFVDFQTVNDYFGVEELDQMRKEARNLSFSELIERHGSIRKILDFHIVEPEELRGKLDLEKGQLGNKTPRLRGADGEISSWQLFHQDAIQELTRA